MFLSYYFEVPDECEDFGFKSGEIDVDPARTVAAVRDAISSEVKATLDSAGLEKFELEIYAPLGLKREPLDEADRLVIDFIKNNPSRLSEDQLVRDVFTNASDDSVVHVVARVRQTAGAGRKAGSADGSANDLEEFRAHGYVLLPVPKAFVDEKGGVWTPLFQLPENIRQTRRLLGGDERLIAKKVRADSDEVDIFKLLDSNSSCPKSEHIISLLDSFATRSGQWIILPKLDTVRTSLMFEPSRIRDKVAPICWGLIKGLAHLHRLCIAHRDIKPDNLLLDANAGYCLKIIDFGCAIQMKDENEEVDADDICGTETWMAPEVEDTSCPYSPIKADRWACGRFILHILDTLRDEDSVLKAVGRMLKVDDPQQRPPLLEWQNWASSLLTDGTPDDAAASDSSCDRKVIPKVRKREVEDGESNDAKRHKDSGIDI